MVSPDLHQQLLCEIGARNGEGALDLSPREREVLALLADGFGAAGIGPRLHISAGTVKKHIARLHQKLGCANSTAAVAKALRDGFIE